ncbi:MAG TPA: hypothetical protein VMV58_04860 [Desulfosporosinus sp.]|nr:hypothetical protein [Desulfosporosinus sp.]
MRLGRKNAVQVEFGKGSAKVKYIGKASIPLLLDMCGKIFGRSKTTASKISWGLKLYF